MQNILIVTELEDLHAHAVISHFEQSRVKYYILPPSRLLTEFSFATSFASIGQQTEFISVDPANSLLNLDTVGAIWYRKPNYPEPPKRVENLIAREFASSETQEWLHGVFESSNCYWMSKPQSIIRAENLVLQMVEARNVGLTVPETIITNDPEQAANFCARFEGIVCKSIQRPYLYKGKNLTGYKRFLDSETISRILPSVANSASIFQRYIHKQVEIRATIVKDEVFSAEIHSQADILAKDDWRFNVHHLEHRKHNLPLVVEEQLIALVKRLGLQFGAADLILTPENQYYFLEVNPNGQWLWVEEKTSLPISNAIAATLIAQLG